ncbi:MAG: hypothetical protein M5U34_07815 [Chloroflexi bacterium]|nr:hypothetical protein [Chloroflexota bacterium]
MIGLIVTGWWVAAQTLDDSVFLPMVMKAEPPPEPMVEFRGLWVTRFDWTTWDGAHPAKIDEIVQNTADAGFNVLFFQVRGEAMLITPRIWNPGRNASPVIRGRWGSRLARNGLAWATPCHT